MTDNHSLNKNSPEFIEEDNKLKKLVEEISYMLNNYRQFLPFPQTGKYDTTNYYD